METLSHETARFTPRVLQTMFKRIRRAIADYPRAMLFELASRGYDSVFEQLVACLLSIRTFDEVSGPAALRLFAKARDPEALSRLDLEEIAELIHGVTFPGQKARTLKTIAGVARKLGGLPADFDALTALPGVGPKCANLVLGIAAGRPSIGVDIHVHRVTNRWGLVHASTPEKTLAQLERVLPKKHWIEINELLVPFGKHICTRVKPHCPTCPVYEDCARVGVTSVGLSKDK